MRIGWAIYGCALVLPLPAVADEAASSTSTRAATDLAPVIVNGQRNPLEDADRRLKALQQSLPGVDEPRHHDFMERAADYYQAHRDPETLKPDEQARMLHLMGRDDQARNPSP